MIFLFKWVIFRFHVTFRGCYKPPKKKYHPSPTPLSSRRSRHWTSLKVASWRLKFNELFLGEFHFKNFLRLEVKQKSWNRQLLSVEVISLNHGWSIYLSGLFFSVPSQIKGKPQGRVHVSLLESPLPSTSWMVASTLPETNIAHESRPSQKETRIPSILFQVRAVSFREGEYQGGAFLKQTWCL